MRHIQPLKCMFSIRDNENLFSKKFSGFPAFSNFSKILHRRLSAPRTPPEMRISTLDRKFCRLYAISAEKSCVNQNPTKFYENGKKKKRNFPKFLKFLKILQASSLSSTDVAEFADFEHRFRMLRSFKFLDDDRSSL